MRSKTILSIVAFIAAFGLSAAFANIFITETQTESVYIPVYGSKSTNSFYRNDPVIADKITALIRQDNRNGRESDRAYYDYGAEIFSSSDNSAISGYAKAVEWYVEQSSSINASDLPSDFQIKWREHMKAWRDCSDFLNRMKKPSNRAALTSEELKEVEAFHDREITRTWKEVQLNGANYGADVY